MQREIEKSVQALTNAKTILYPTDTVWGIGCDATDEIAVKKIYHIKRREESKSLIILVSSFEMLQKYIVDIPEIVRSFLLENKKPTTVIYKNPKGIALNAIADDNTVALRIVQDEFCQELIHKFGKPVVSTSANISGALTPKTFNDISKPILDSVDYIVNLAREEINLKTSSIIRIRADNTIEIIRD